MMIFRVIAYTAIAFAAIAVLLSITGLLAPGFAGQAMCGAYQGVLSIIPLPQETKPPLPSFCFPNERKLERLRLNLATNRELAEKLAYYIDRCWGSADSGKHATSFVCYELYSDKTTTEKDIAAAMRLQKVCDRVGNSRIDSSGDAESCGTSNSVFISQASLTGTIIIRYEAGLHRISVS